MEQRIYSEKVLGLVIRQQRKDLKLTQSQAGQTFRIDQTTVSSIENGATGTHLDTLLKLLAALDLEMIIRPKPSLAAASDRKA
jgi:HTH-type transcriptional regulator / antitoxin HipB